MNRQNEMPGVKAGNLKPTPGPVRGGSSSRGGNLKKRNLFLPIILVVMGVVVVTIMIALYLPIFSLGQTSTMGGR